MHSHILSSSTAPMAGGAPPGRVGGQPLFSSEAPTGSSGAPAALTREDAEAIVSQTVNLFASQLGIRPNGPPRPDNCREFFTGFQEETRGASSVGMNRREAPLSKLSLGSRVPAEPKSEARPMIPHDGPLSRQEMLDMVTVAVTAAQGQRTRDAPSIFETDGEDGRMEISGAKGAAHYVKLKASFEASPDYSFHDTRRRARTIL